MFTTSMLLMTAVASFTPADITQRSQGTKHAHTDRYGDPLPKEAIARLGTLRFVHPGGIASVALSRDGTLVASGGISAKHGPNAKQRVGTIRIWQAATGKLLREIETPENRINCLCFSPDGKNLVGTCDAESTGAHRMYLWDLATGQPVWKVKLNRQPYVTQLAFEKGKRLVSTHAQYVLYSLDDPKGKFVGFRDDYPKVWVHVWDATSGKRMEQRQYFPVPLRQHNPKLALFKNAMVRSADGRFTALAVHKGHIQLKNGDLKVPHFRFFDKHVKIFDNRTDKLLHEVRGFKKCCRHLAFTPDGNHLAAAEEGKIWLIDVKDGKKRLFVKDPSANIHKIHFLARGKILAVAVERNLKVGFAIENCFWDVATGKLIARHKMYRHWSALAADECVYATHTGYAVRLWNYKTLKEQSPIPGHRFVPDALYFQSPKTLVSWGDGRHKWNWKTGDLVRSLPHHHPDTTNALQVGDISYREQLYTALITKKRTLELRDLVTHKTVRVVKTNIRPNHAERLSSTGKTLLIVDGANWSFYDVASGKKRAEVKTPVTVRQYPFVFHDHVVATQTHDGHVIVVNIDKGKVAHRLKPSFLPIRIQFSPDQRFLFTMSPHISGKRWSINMWDLKTGKVLSKTIHRAVAVNKFEDSDLAVFSPDGRLLVTAKRGSNDMKIREVISGRRRAVLRGHADEINQVVFTPDGKHLASASWDTTILIWNIKQALQPSGPLKKRLTEKEWLTYWKTLGDENAEKANIAIWAMVAAENSVSFLRTHLPLREASAQQIQKWIADLDSNRFAVRTRAMLRLQQVGEPAVPALRRALKQKQPLEVHLRLTKLLDELTSLGPTPRRLQQARAVEVLEYIGTRSARQLLQELAAGPASAWLTLEAQRCWSRMK